MVGEEDQCEADDDFDDRRAQGVVGFFGAGDGGEGAQDEEEDGYGGGEARGPGDNEAEQVVEGDVWAREDG